MSNYALALAFDTDDPEFVRGVEVGRLWETMNNTPGEFEETLHIANAGMVWRMVEAQNRNAASKELDGIWMTVKFGASHGFYPLRTDNG